MDLLDILKRPEGKALEFKRDLSSPDGALKTLTRRTWIRCLLDWDSSRLRARHGPRPGAGPSVARVRYATSLRTCRARTSLINVW